MALNTAVFHYLRKVTDRFSTSGTEKVQLAHTPRTRKCRVMVETGISPLLAELRDSRLYCIWQVKFEIFDLAIITFSNKDVWSFFVRLCSHSVPPIPL